MFDFSENCKWIIGTLISIIVVTIMCLSIPDIKMDTKVIIASITDLIIIIAILGVIVFQKNNREKQIYTSVSGFGEKYNSLIKEVAQIKSCIEHSNEENNESAILEEVSQKLEPFSTFEPFDLNEFTISAASLDKGKTEIRRLKVKNKDELLECLDSLENGQTVIYYEDYNREARITRFKYQEKWQLYYERRGFSVVIEDFCVEGLMNNEYFSNSLSWLTDTSEAIILEA